MLKRNSSALASGLVVVLTLMFAIPAAAQDTQPSKVDLFAGYAYADTGSKGFVPGMKAMNRGFTAAGTYWTSRYIGMTVDSGFTWGENFTRLTTVQAGPSVRYPTEHATVFGHALAGLYDLRVPTFGSNGNIGITAGGGLDLNVSKHFDIRLAQGDFEWGRYSTLLKKSEFAGGRFASGLVFKFGTIGPPPAPPSAACSLQPTEVYEGEPVTATATGSNFNPKRTLTYTWSGTGVNVTGSGPTGNIDTKGLQPGQYTVKANISDGKKGTAECTTSFTVKQPRPPQISCSANPSTVQPNGTSTITSNGSSPDGRNLTYNYTASAGRVSGNGSSATLNTSGAQPGPITVNCTATDDRNLSASSSTTVTVEAPPPAPAPPPKPEASKLNEISFKKNSPRVDNAAKAILDEVALRLQRDADAKAVVVGNADAKETGAKKLAAQRAVNAKAYLVKEKGIDASRIEARTGSGGTQNAEIWLVPAGASFDAAGTDVVSEKVKASPAKAAPKKKAAVKK
jgi:outer membrane protein OmpA-like peptidoglycan-associated protein